MIYKALFDIKKGDDIYICDKCEKHTDDPRSIPDDESVYCFNCFDFICGMGDLAAESAIERELEEKYDREHKE